MKTLIKYKYFLGTVGVILAFVVYKFRFLSLPYYWDEAWPYGVAVRTMHANGISLIPGAIDTFLARGHPLMFHFMGAAWMNIFGTSVTSGHSFMMCVSAVTLLTMYYFCKSFFSERVGFIAVLLFATQAVFIAQSVFLMPEMLVAMWAMLALYAYLRQRYILFVAFASALILTKESGGVLPIALGFSELVRFLFTRKRNFAKFVKRAAIIAVPVGIAALFFIIQKAKYGWYLYPFYMDYLKTDWLTRCKNIPEGAAYFFVYYGRNAITFVMLIMLGIILFSRKINFTDNEKRVLPVMSCFVLFYLQFSYVNYYIPRYLLCAFPPFIIIATAIIDKGVSAIKVPAKKILYPILIAGFAVTNIFYYITVTNGDIDYSPSINTDLKMVKYCEQEKLFDSYIFTTCVLRYDFNEPYDGYLSGTKFTHIQWEFDGHTQYCIFSKDEYDGPLFDKIKSENKLTLIKRFEEGYAWVEMYKVERK